MPSIVSDIDIPLYRRGAEGNFEVFAVMRVLRILHTCFLAEILVGGVHMWYSGRVSTCNASDASDTHSLCMVGEFISLRTPLPVNKKPQHMIWLQTGIAALVTAADAQRGNEKKAHNPKGVKGEPKTASALRATLAQT